MEEFFLKRENEGRICRRYFFWPFSSKLGLKKYPSSLKQALSYTLYSTREKKRLCAKREDNSLPR